MRLIILFCMCTLVTPSFCMKSVNEPVCSDWSKASVRYDKPVTSIQPGEGESLLPHDQRRSWKPWACAYSGCALTVCSLWVLASICG